MNKEIKDVDIKEQKKEVSSALDLINKIISGFEEESEINNSYINVRNDLNEILFDLKTFENAHNIYINDKRMKKEFSNIFEKLRLDIKEYSDVEPFKLKKELVDKQYWEEYELYPFIEKLELYKPWKSLIKKNINLKNCFMILCLINKMDDENKDKYQDDIDMILAVISFIL